MARCDADGNGIELQNGSRLACDNRAITTSRKLSFDEVPGAPGFVPACAFAFIFNSALQRRKMPLTCVTRKPCFGHLGPGGVGKPKLSVTVRGVTRHGRQNRISNS